MTEATTKITQATGEDLTRLGEVWNVKRETEEEFRARVVATIKGGPRGFDDAAIDAALAELQDDSKSRLANSRGKLEGLGVGVLFGLAVGVWIGAEFLSGWFQ